MIRASSCLTAAALSLVLAGCAASGDYPSLARRPVERIAGTAEAVTPAPRPVPPSPPPSTELTGRLAQLVAQARAAHQRFAERRGNAEKLVGAASGATAGSESWSVASVALGELESARSDTMLPLAELDELYAAEAVKASQTGSTGSAEAARAAQQQIGALVAEEDEVLDRLRARL